jgi:hypothetical protein
MPEEPITHRFGTRPAWNPTPNDTLTFAPIVAALPGGGIKPVWPNTESTLSLRKYHSQNRCGLLNRTY